MQASHKGLIMVQVILRPDCYIDMDIEKNYTFEVHARDPKAQDNDYFVHPEDMEAAKAKSLFQEMLQGDAPDSDDEEEEEPPVDANKKEASIDEASNEDSDDEAPALVPVESEEEQLDFAE
jgi:hypothetical protein